MSRQQALNEVWRKLLIVFVAIGALSIVIAYQGDNIRTPALICLFGNMGAYVGVHRNLTQLSDDEVIGLAESWFGLVVPSFVGGILAFVLYLLFLSDVLNVISTTIFPNFEPDTKVKDLENFEKIWHQHGKTIADYAKLFFWSFMAGFNQKYAVDIIESVKSKI